MKEFLIFKVSEKKSEKSPDYRITISNNGKWTDIGAGWVKEGKKGKFISCKLSDGYKDLAGYKIVPDSGISAEEKAHFEALRDAENTSKGIGKDEIKANEIPF